MLNLVAGAQWPLARMHPLYAALPYNRNRAPDEHPTNTLVAAFQAILQLLSHTTHTLTHNTSTQCSLRKAHTPLQRHQRFQPLRTTQAYPQPLHTRLPKVSQHLAAMLGKLAAVPSGV